MKESVIFQNLSSKSMILRDLRQSISWNWSLCLQFMSLILMLMSDIVEDINIKQIIRIILGGNDLKQQHMLTLSCPIHAAQRPHLLDQ